MPHPIVDENIARLASQQHGFTEPAKRMEQHPFFLDVHLCEYRVQSIAFNIAGTQGLSATVLDLAIFTAPGIAG